MALADVFDALISERPYKPAWTHRRGGIAHVLSQSGKHFDPDCVEALLRDVAQVQLIAQTQLAPPPHLFV